MPYIRSQANQWDSRTLAKWCLGLLLCGWMLYSLVGPMGVWAAMQKRNRLKELQQSTADLVSEVSVRKQRVQSLENSANLLREMEEKGKSKPVLPQLEDEIRRSTDVVRPDEKVYKTPEPPAQPATPIEGRN